MLFQNCTSGVKKSHPTKEEMEIGYEKSINSGKKLESELRLIKDLDVGIIRAKEEEKPIILIFTGFGVVNSRRLENEVILKNQKIFSLMKNNFVNVWLYVDDRRNSGTKWSDLQAYTFNGNYQPQIFILDSNGRKLDGGIGYEESKNELLPLLEKYRN